MKLKKHTYFVKTTSFMLSLVLFLFYFLTIPVWAAISPTITTQPASQAVEVGQSASFSVTATGTVLSYQWQKNGSGISGATTATLNIPNVQGTNAGSYTVVVSDSVGSSVTSNVATLMAIDITTLGFASPTGVAVDSSGKIYIADTYNNAVKKMDADGTNIVTLGSGFNRPYRVAVDSSGKIYVADAGNNAIKKMDADGTNIVTLGSGFSNPRGVVVDSSGKIYVADTGNNAIKKMDADGTNIVTLGSGFDRPYGVAVDSSGKIYVADTNHSAIKKMDADGTNIVTLFSIFIPTGVAVDSSGKIYVVAYFLYGIKKMDADGTNIVTLGSGLNQPYGVAVDSSGKIYVADYGHSAIKKMDADGTNIVTLGLGFNRPTGVAVDSSGKIYVSDTNNSAIKKMDADGTNIVTLGSGFLIPYDVAVDSSGKIYVADTNHSAIKKMDADGTNIVTLGLGFNRPTGVAVDSSGKIYVSDTNNSAIKKMDADGTNIVTLGSGFDGPYGVEVDSSGKIYFADYANRGIKKMQTIYGVTYDSNGSDGGSVPTDVTNYVYGQSVTILGNSGNLEKTGFTFAGWNTTTTGSSISYQPGNTFTLGADNVTLYAQWNVTYTVSIGSLTGGSITANPTAATTGSAITLTVTPDGGKQLQAGSLKYNDGSDHAISGTSFTMPATNVMVSAVFEAIPGGDNSGSSHTSTPNPGTSTVTGSVIDGNGTQVSNLTATVTADSNEIYSVTMKAAQTVMLKQPDGTTSSLSDLSKVTFTTAAGLPVTVSADGTINLTNLAKGTDNHFNITYDLGNGQSITIGTLDVTVSSSGEVSLTCTLIDPYGVIIDAATGKPIVGANVTLYYANTDRNKTDGKTPDTVVPLPGIDGFKPNNNINPQLSDASGAYGFMVFPTTDYYLVATKEGYNNYTSPTISVEQDIVRWDFKMNQTTSGVTRLAGLNSVDTALAIAKASYTGTVANVILATADNYPDALAGSVLAYKLNAPLLLVGSADADQEKILAYMKSNLNPAGKVYILGGTAVVSSAMESKVTASGFANIIRLGGTDRYETSVKIAEQLKVETGTPLVLAYGDNYPDALSISSIAAEMQYPILLVQKDEMSDAVKSEITAIKPSKVYIIGGEGVISATLENRVAQITSLDKTNIVRIAGADRYETSLAVAEYFDLSGQSVCIATGNNFPDALAGSVYAANHNAPIILADGRLSDQVMNYLKGKKLTGATLFGGEAVVSKDIEQQLRQLMGK